MTKRSQVSLFILLGVLLILFLLLFIILSGRKTDITGEAEETEYIQSIKNYVSICLKETAKDAIFTISQQGGYYNVPSLFKVNGTSEIPYYFYNNLVLAPTEKEIEFEISRYINHNLGQCINGFVEFEDKGVEITEGQLKVKAIITSTTVDVDLDYPLTVIEGDSEHTIPRFYESIDVNFKNIYEISKGIIYEIEQEPDFIPVTHLIDISNQNNLEVKLFRMPEDTMVYSLIKNTSAETKYPLIFSFAVKYNWTGRGITDE